MHRQSSAETSSGQGRDIVTPALMTRCNEAPTLIYEFVPHLIVRALDHVQLDPRGKPVSHD